MLGSILLRLRSIWLSVVQVRTDERKQIQTLYRLIEDDKVEGILCYKFDRIFRNMKLSIDLISTLLEKALRFTVWGWKHLKEYTGRYVYGELFAIR